MLTIAFDGICLGDGPVTGVGRAFLTGLAAYAAVGKARCLLLVPTGTPPPPIAGIAIVSAPRGALRRQLALPRLLRELRADVLHSSVAAIPLRAPCSTIATVHDLPWLHRELGEPTSLRRHLAVIRSLRAATAITAPSTLTATDTQALLGERCPPVRIIAHGTARGPEPTSTSTAARAGGLLVLGDDRPRKNRQRLVAAHTAARAICADLPELQFTGPPDAYVDEVQKRALLQTCRALVHPALFEGFGLPVLEGLAHGAPVLCSDLPPHREIAGDAALYCDPRDERALAAALVAIHRDAARRADLAARGWARAAAFAPERTAAAWQALHAEVAR